MGVAQFLAQMDQFCGECLIFLAEPLRRVNVMHVTREFRVYGDLFMYQMRWAA